MSNAVFVVSVLRCPVAQQYEFTACACFPVWSSADKLDGIPKISDPCESRTTHDSSLHITLRLNLNSPLILQIPQSSMVALVMISKNGTLNTNQSCR